MLSACPPPPLVDRSPEMEASSSDQTMTCEVPAKNLKLLSAALACLGKIGKDVFIEFTSTAVSSGQTR